MPTTYTPRAMLEKLIAFRTVSRDSNLDLIHFVRDYLAEYGVESTLIHDETGQKANLYAIAGPKTEGGYVLSGHTDVVPVDGQSWSSDPFSLTERDGKLYGRGTADMKTFSAIGLALVPEMVAADLKRPIHFALSYDEEVGCQGADQMIRVMAGKVPKPEAVIIGEPTMMEVVNAHKGTTSVDVHVRGFEVHSSLYPIGVSAVMQAARLIEWCRQTTAANATRAAEMSAAGGPGSFFPPYSTLHCGVVNGGTAHNITAKDCHFTIDIRTMPEEDGEAYVERLRDFAAVVEQEMKAIRPEASIEATISAYVPGLKTEDDGAAERLARAITGDNADHVVSYGTEAGQFQNAGWSSIVCGPGSIEQAHQPDEFIAIDQVEAGTAFVREVIHRAAA